MINQPATKSSRSRILLIGSFIALILSIGLFIAGFIKGSAPVAGLRSQLEQGQTQLLIAQNRGYLMQARVALYQTAIDLDQRNFGIANTRLQEAARALENIKEGSDAIDMAAINELRASITAMNINVAMNLEEQRAQILHFASQLDNLMGESTN